jgi:hypothetical protein
MGVRCLKGEAAHETPHTTHDLLPRTNDKYLREQDCIGGIQRAYRGQFFHAEKEAHSMSMFYQTVDIPGLGSFGTGWLQPMPDLRDLTPEVKEIKAFNKDLKLTAAAAAPTSVDLREWCSEIEDQKNIGSCTAQAAVGVVEYFQNRAFKKHHEGSRLFVYKVTRNLMEVTGDTGLAAQHHWRAQAIGRAAGALLALRSGEIRRRAERICVFRRR